MDYMFACNVYSVANKNLGLYGEKDKLFCFGIIPELVNVELESVVMPSHASQQHSSRFVKICNVLVLILTACFPLN